MNALEECHNELARLIRASGAKPETLDVFRCAEQHRVFWRPRNVRVLLLAESHVYTSDSALERRVDLSRFTNLEVPRGFVRLVYCLGYGENGLLDQPLPKNDAGTWQYWKIFYSCLHFVKNTKDDFSPITKKATTFEQRINNKLDLLRRLQDAGVWLLDASLAALYPKKLRSPTRMTKCIQTSWDIYVGNVVRSARPSHIIRVGEGKVAQDSLQTRLEALGVPMTVIPQPQDHLSSEEHLRAFQRCFNIVNSTQ
jgi:hypothetical protein